MYMLVVVVFAENRQNIWLCKLLLNITCKKQQRKFLLCTFIYFLKLSLVTELKSVKNFLMDYICGRAKGKLAFEIS